MRSGPSGHTDRRKRQGRVLEDEDLEWEWASPQATRRDGKRAKRHRRNPDAARWEHWR